MIFIQNGVIRSMSSERIADEIKLLLVGKTMGFQRDSILIRDISIEGDYVLFHGAEHIHEVAQVKKIEIDMQYELLRITSRKEQLLVTISDPNKRKNTRR